MFQWVRVVLLFSFLWRDSIDSLSINKHPLIAGTFIFTSDCLDDVLGVDMPYFEDVVNQFHSARPQLSRSDKSYTKLAFLYFRWICSSKSYEKRNDFDLNTVKFPFVDSDVPRPTSERFYIFKLIWFAEVSWSTSVIVIDQDCLTYPSYRYHKLWKDFFSKRYRRHIGSFSKFRVGLRAPLQGLVGAGVVLYCGVVTTFVGKEILWLELASLISSGWFVIFWFCSLLELHADWSRISVTGPT